MKNKRILSILLTVLVASSTCSSCAEERTEPVTETTADLSVAVTETEVVDLFADIDFGGAEVRMFVSTKGSEGETSSAFTIWTEDITGEVVSDAVFQRNAEVEEKLNVKLFLQKKN